MSITIRPLGILLTVRYITNTGDTNGTSIIIQPILLAVYIPSNRLSTTFRSFIPSRYTFIFSTWFYHLSIRLIRIFSSSGIRIILQSIYTSNFLRILVIIITNFVLVLYIRTPSFIIIDVISLGGFRLLTLQEVLGIQAVGCSLVIYQSRFLISSSGASRILKATSIRLNSLEWLLFTMINVYSSVSSYDSVSVQEFNIARLIRRAIYYMAITCS